MIKYFKYIILAIIVGSSLMFSGCSYTWLFHNNNSDDTNTTDYSRDPYQEPDKDPLTYDGDTPTFDPLEYFDNTLGLKVCYDASDYIIDITNDINFSQVFSLLEQKIGNDGADFDYTEFLTNYPLIIIDENYISRVMFIINIIEQYKSLAELILTEIWADYGLGIETNTILSNAFYGDYSFVNAIEPNESNNSNINYSKYSYTNIINVPNPDYYPDGPEALIEEENFSEYQTLTIDLDENEIVSEGYSWRFNTLTEGDVVDEIEIDNPYYYPTHEINTLVEGHLFSYEKIYIQAIYYSDGIEYQISYTESEELDKGEELNKFIEKYKDYYALKIMQYLTDEYEGISASENFTVNSNDFIELIQAFVENINVLGDFETTDDVFYEMMINEIVGSEAVNYNSQLSTSDERFINFYIEIQEIALKFMQLHVEYESNSSNILIDSDGEYSFEYFTVVQNVEYKDYSIAELVGETEVNIETVTNEDESDIVEDDDFYVDTENILSVVIMMKETEDKQYFTNFMILLLSLNNDLNIETFARYVLDGSELIFEQIDYEALLNGDDGHFNGTLAQLLNGEDGIITVDYMNNATLSIDGDTFPDTDTLSEDVYTNSFVNNLVATFSTHANTLNFGQIYKYDSQSGVYYYNDEDENCDFIEFLFKTSSNTESNYLKWTFSLLSLMIDSE